MNITTKSTVTKDIEISVPMFKKKNDDWQYYVAILNDKTGISITLSEETGYFNITHSPPHAMDHSIIPALNWEDISEEEFLEAHEKALQSLSLKPQLVEDNPNDLKGVNI